MSVLQEWPKLEFIPGILSLISQFCIMGAFLCGVYRDEPSSASPKPSLKAVYGVHHTKHTTMCLASQSSAGPWKDTTNRVELAAAGRSFLPRTVLELGLDHEMTRSMNQLESPGASPGPLARIGVRITSFAVMWR